jgi:formate--tetrahydrofolate ligase
VQTLENNPVFVHGGPFANIAHGCNSVIATTLGLKLADYVVTEAGFGADLGAEKFFDIKCRKAGIAPSAVVVVATVRALKMHGGVAKADLGAENVEAVKKGFVNLERHLENIAKFGVPAVVAINKFIADTAAEHELIAKLCAEIGVEAILCSHWADGSKGTEKLAHAVVKLAESGKAAYKPLYNDEMSLLDKVRTIATQTYGASEVTADQKVRDLLKDFTEGGFGHYPVCIAKTQYSFSSDPALKGAPTGFTLPVRDLRLSAGAGFVVALVGEMPLIPGLPTRPCYYDIDVDADSGKILGLS